jgi:hypothetical protein
MNSYLRPGLLFLACLLLFTIPEPETLRDILLDGLLGAVLILISMNLIFTDKSYIDPHPALSYMIIGIAGAFLTGIFWFRITDGSYGIETGFAVNIAKTFFFWMPAALFAMLYRADGEGWIPGKRGAILTRLLFAVGGSLVGLAAGEIARTQIDSVPLESAFIHLERQLPDGNSLIDYRSKQSILYLDVILDPSFTEPNIHTLQRLRAIAGHAAHLTNRSDTDSLNLRILHNDTELAVLSWPDSTTNRPVDQLNINYSGTDLSSLPTPEDLGYMFDIVQEVFRPKNLDASLYGSTLVLQMLGHPKKSSEIPRDPLEIPEIIHDWQSANHIAIRAAGLFEGLESIRLQMPDHTVSVSTDSIYASFRFQQLLPVSDVSVRIQIYNNEEMPELPQTSGGAPIMILWGDGEFDTRQNRVGPLWPWEKATLAGYEFHITDLEADGTVHFVFHPFGYPEESRWMRLQPGQVQQLDSVYLRNLE